MLFFLTFVQGSQTLYALSQMDLRHLLLPKNVAFGEV